LGLPFVLLSLGLAVLRLPKKARKYKRDRDAYFAVDRYKCVYRVIKKLLYVKHVKVEVKGLKNVPKKPVLFIANHKSQLDAIVLIKALFEHEGLPYFSLLAKQELKKRKYVCAAMELIDTIFIDRDNIRSNFEAFENQKKAMQDGRSVIIFPEGHRYYSDQFGEFKVASLKVVYQNYAPVVPLVIYGTSGLLDKDKSNVNHKKHVYIEVLDMIKHNDFAITKDEQVVNKLQSSMQQKYNELKKLAQEKKPVFDKE
jgi:1-acyl-sn-glycerol-3-phosphate acyltransferase